MQVLERSADGIDLRILNVSDSDMSRAAPDAIATNIGAGPVTPHPLAEDLYHVSLATIAAHFGGLVSTNNAAHGIKAVQAGMGSLEFKQVVESVGRRVIEKAYSRDDTLNKIARALPKPSLKHDYLASVELTNGLDEVSEGAERPLLKGAVNDRETAPIKSYGLAILIQRRDVINNDQRLVGQLFDEAGQLAQRHELKTTMGYIESNPTLPELDSRGGADRAWFGSGDGNLLTGQTADLSGLEAGNKALREQTAPNGDQENIAARFVLCSPDHEFTLRQIIHEAGLPLEVMPSAHIDGSRFYMLADPARQPALGVKFIGNPTDRRIKTWSLSPVRKLPIELDGIGYVLDVDLAPVAISRKGIVRVELA